MQALCVHRKCLHEVHVPILGNVMDKELMGKLFGVALRLLYKIRTYYNVIAIILISHIYYSLMWNNVVKGTESQDY